MLNLCMLAKSFLKSCVILFFILINSAYPQAFPEPILILELKGRADYRSLSGEKLREVSPWLSVKEGDIFYTASELRLGGDAYLVLKTGRWSKLHLAKGSLIQMLPKNEKSLSYVHYRLLLGQVLLERFEAENQQSIFELSLSGSAFRLQEGRAFLKMKPGQPDNIELGQLRGKASFFPYREAIENDSESLAIVNAAFPVREGERWKVSGLTVEKKTPGSVTLEKENPFSAKNLRIDPEIIPFREEWQFEP